MFSGLLRESRGSVVRRGSGVKRDEGHVYAVVNDVELRLFDDLIEAPYASYVHTYARGLGLVGALDSERGVIKYSASKGVLEEIKKRVVDLLEKSGEERKLYVLYVNAKLEDPIVDVEQVSLRNNPLFEKINLVKWHTYTDIIKLYDTFSIKAPVFIGVATIASDIDPELISDNIVDYVELPYTPGAIREALRILGQYSRESSSRDDWDRWWRMIKEALIALKSKLTPPTVKIPAVIPGLIQVKIIVSTMPTEYIEEVRDKPELVSRLRALRKKFYDALHDYAFRAHEFWVLYHDVYVDAVKKLIDEIHGELEKLGFTGKYIWLIDAQLPREFLVDGIRKYMSEKRELYKKLIQEELAGVLTAKRRRQVELERAKIEKEMKKLEKELNYIATTSQI